MRYPVAPPILNGAMMSRWVLLLLVFLTGGNVAASEADPLAAVSFLAGQWRGVDGERVTEEHYMRSAAGTMPGMHRTYRPGRPPQTEFIRIEFMDGKIVYRAFPEGQSPADFPLVAQGPGLAVFANPAHDFPQKITYRLEGDGLTCTIEGPDKQGRTRQAQWRWQRVGAAP